ncbi:MAG: hypothetical protein ACPGSL_03420 [Vicingaceae bacterium]
MLQKITRKIFQYKDKLSSENKIHKSFNIAYKNRNWEAFDLILEEENKNTITYRCWEAMKLGYFMQLKNPQEAWGEIHKDARVKKHFLAQFAFKNYIFSLINPAGFNELKKELPKLNQLYNTYCPLIYITGICALYIKNNEFKACLNFISDLNQIITDKSTRSQLKLRTYSYYVICKQKLSNEVSSIRISEDLVGEMDKVYLPGSPAKNVLNECIACWDVIKSKSIDLLLDLRYSHYQEKQLKEKVKIALEQKEPFLLLRLGDGEAYAFAENSEEYKDKIIETLEDFWWGTTLKPELRSEIIGDFIKTFDAADVVGFPYTIRLSHILTSFTAGKLTYSDIRLKVLYNGVKDYLNKKSNIPSKIWTDEYCNYAFVEEAYMSNLINISTNVVLVTCFKIPDSSIFNHKKVKVVNAPPVKKISLVNDVVSNEKSLPEIMSSLKKEVEPHISEGTLLLLSAGFAGKSILKVAKDKGAVAIDFGSSIDHILGYKTRNLELHNLH